MGIFDDCEGVVRAPLVGARGVGKTWALLGFYHWGTTLGYLRADDATREYMDPRYTAWRNKEFEKLKAGTPKNTKRELTFYLLPGTNIMPPHIKKKVKLITYDISGEDYSGTIDPGVSASGEILRRKPSDFFVDSVRTSDFVITLVDIVGGQERVLDPKPKWFVDKKGFQAECGEVTSGRPHGYTKIYDEQTGLFSCTQPDCSKKPWSDYRLEQMLFVEEKSHHNEIMDFDADIGKYICKACGLKIPAPVLPGKLNWTKGTQDHIVNQSESFASVIEVLRDKLGRKFDELIFPIWFTKSDKFYNYVKVNNLNDLFDGYANIAKASINGKYKVFSVSANPEKLSYREDWRDAFAFDEPVKFMLEKKFPPKR